jgi:hypothetical protein
MRKLILVPMVAALASLAACGDKSPDQTVTVDGTSHQFVMHEYRQNDSSSNDWIYWYVLYAANTSGGNYAPVAYYKSSTQVTSLNSQTFTKVDNGKLPQDVEEDIDHSEEMGEMNLGVGSTSAKATVPNEEEEEEPTTTNSNQATEEEESPSNSATTEEEESSPATSSSEEEEESTSSSSSSDDD